MSKIHFKLSKCTLTIHTVYRNKTVFIYVQRGYLKMRIDFFSFANVFFFYKKKYNADGDVYRLLSVCRPEAARSELTKVSHILRDLFCGGKE